MSVNLTGILLSFVTLNVTVALAFTSPVFFNANVPVPFVPGAMMFSVVDVATSFSSPPLESLIVLNKSIVTVLLVKSAPSKLHLATRAVSLPVTVLVYFAHNE